MRFTRDICRLLGLGGDGPGGEDMDVQDGVTDSTGRRRRDLGSSQTMLTNEEGLDDEEKTRRRAERRRAKRKRQKERKKLERQERTEDVSEQEEEAAGEELESDSEDELKEEQKWTAVRPRNKCISDSVPALVTIDDKSNHQLANRSSEEEPEWDISSAFVANAASNIKMKGLKRKTSQISRENKENEARGGQVDTTEEMKRRGASLTAQGIQMFEQGQYSQAVDMFTEAIYCDPNDHRFYGNRSYCYWCLEEFSLALTDAQRSIQLAPDWPKGYFRKGCALMGLKQLSEAEKAMEEVLRLDQRCKEASSKLFTCRVLQLRAMGFEEEESKHLLDKFTTIQAVIASTEAKTLRQTSPQEQNGSCRSLWVGNITVEVTEQDLWDLFKMFGEIESIRVLHERFCAFVNFKNANMAAIAKEKLQGVELGSSKLVMRYPDRWAQRTLPVLPKTNSEGIQSTPAVTGPKRKSFLFGDECFYWRTTGCFYGEKCRFRHIPDQQGRDMKP